MLLYRPCSAIDVDDLWADRLRVGLLNDHFFGILVFDLDQAIWHRSVSRRTAAHCNDSAAILVRNDQVVEVIGLVQEVGQLCASLITVKVGVRDVEVVQGIHATSGGDSGQEVLCLIAIERVIVDQNL